MRKIIYIIFLTLVLAACANLGTPDGGAFDEDPPKILGTSPKYGAVNAKNKKIVLMFDENIKLDNAMEKVVISPPQINQPEIEAMGKRITITLNDSLKPNTTYTIDFSDAIQDNNEGNPMDDYAFTFSTGEMVDTFQISGYVLGAADLEPMKGLLVGLHRIEEGEEDLPDSIFRTREFERVSRTDASGHFVIKGLNPETRYRAFALKDQDQNFMFTQKSEMIGFNRQIITSSAKPDIKHDTIWHDSIHYDSIISIPYTHFYPDNIVLTAFEEEGQNRAFLKWERPQLERFTLFFTAPDSTLPVIKGLNFNADNAFVIEASENKDTITYWVKDSTIYNNDTLRVTLTYNYTDTLNRLVERTDTQNLLSKVTYEKLQKKRKDEWEDYKKEYLKEFKHNQRKSKSGSENGKKQEKAVSGQTLIASGEAKKEKSEEELIYDEYYGGPTTEQADSIISPPPATELADNEEDDGNEEENMQKEEADSKEKSKKSSKKSKRQKKTEKEEDIEIPPMPEEFIDVKTNSGNINPDQNIDFTFSEPIDTAYTSMFHFYHLVDSVEHDLPFVLRRVKGTTMKYRLYAEWEPDSTYYVSIDTGAVVNIYGQRMAGMKKTIKVKGLDKFSQLTVNLQNAEDCAYVSLINQSGKVVKQQKAENGKVDFYYIDPGNYYLSMFYDRNGDGRWTTGDYDSQRQPEETFYYPGALNLRAQWEVNQSWNPTQTPLFRQKPEKITKQKPEKKKDRRSKNEERRREKANQK